MKTYFISIKVWRILLSLLNCTFKKHVHTLSLAVNRGQKFMVSCRIFKSCLKVRAWTKTSQKKGFYRCTDRFVYHLCACRCERLTCCKDSDLIVFPSSPVLLAGSGKKKAPEVKTREMFQSGAERHHECEIGREQCGAGCALGVTPGRLFDNRSHLKLRNRIS